MNLRHLSNSLKKNVAVVALVTSALLLAGISLSTFNWKSAISVDSGNTAQAFDTASNADPTAPQGERNGSTFKRIVTAPVRLFARIFRRDDNTATVAKNIPTLTSSDTAVATALEREAAASFDQAVELHQKKQLDNAIAKLTAVVGIQPNNAEAYNLLGVCYDEKGQYREAQDEYKKAVKLEPINARFLNNLGYSFYLAGNDKQAIRWYQRALKFTPNDPRLQNNLGLAFGRRGEFGKAKDLFLKAVGEHGALLNLGYLYNQQGRYQLAIEQFEAALKLQPDSLVAMSHLAQIYNRVGRIRESEMLSAQYKKMSNTDGVQREQTAEQKLNQEKEDQ